jgi:hypothetical protein
MAVPMRPSLVEMLFLLGVLLLFLAGHWAMLREWWQSLSFNRKFRYVFGAVFFAALIVSRFILVDALILMVVIMWLNLVGFIVWFLFLVSRI